MSDQRRKPRNLSDAIARLEAKTRSRSEELRDILGRDFEELQETLADLKPQLEELKSAVENEVKSAARDVDDKVRKNPWIALGLVGLIAFVIGWLLGHGQRE